MLQKTVRTGYQFLGSGFESVAEHTLRTLFVGYALARMAGDVDEHKVLKLCLFHDLPEARTGDQNYVHKKYVSVDEAKAVRDLTEPLPFGGDVAALIEEFNAKETQEARLAGDADQLSLILQLKECEDLGNRFSREWIVYALRRLCTDEAKQLAEAILCTSYCDWWFHDKSDWWVNGNRKTEP